MAKYDSLSKNITFQIKEDRANSKANPFAFTDEFAVRRKVNPHDSGDLLRSNFIRDIDKILNCPYYNRYSDKTQVFSFYKNDDITRRGLHVQLVSRIARTIGKALNLNLELIEAIALGHDLGHTPFGHAGERFLDEIYFSKTNRRFAHNLQSVRVLDKIFPLNVTLQTLDGIAGHNGEIEMEVYKPNDISSFEELDLAIENCYINGENLTKLSPSTLEGLVVRVADIIAYLGKDRQDGTKAKVFNENNFYSGIIGSINAEMVNNLSVNVVENSYGKNYIKFNKEYFLALQQAKKDNYQNLYNNEKTQNMVKVVKPMMNKLYEKLLEDLLTKNLTSPIFTHHINYLNKPYYKREKPYLEQEPNQIVVDFIASMTDDYFIEIFSYLFPKDSLTVEYKGYFK
ncbi:MAG: HD domain-containing protein [Clostridia bacterium]|nr:HD domain-containing protein [Clostridia bacterium]